MALRFSFPFATSTHPFMASKNCDKTLVIFICTESLYEKKSGSATIAQIIILKKADTKTFVIKFLQCSDHFQNRWGIFQTKIDVLNFLSVFSRTTADFSWIKCNITFLQFFSFVKKLVLNGIPSPILFLALQCKDYFKVFLEFRKKWRSSSKFKRSDIWWMVLQKEMFSLPVSKTISWRCSVL